MENKKRLIDANALIAQFDDSFKGFVLARIIDEQPTVDAVEVVRCENCENAVSFSWTAAGEKVQGFRCMKDDGAIGYKCCVSGDDFCSSGKRRVNDAND